MQETRVNNKWTVKILIFLVALAGLGVWGLLDAIWVYPSRGRTYAEWTERLYLEAAQRSGELLQASVETPEETLSELRSERSALREELQRLAASDQGSGFAARQIETRLARLEWLSALAIVGDLSPQHTQFDDPSDRLDTLQSEQANLDPPKPLSAYDIPMQWVFVVVGFGGAGWLAYLMFSVGRRKYRFDPETLTLSLPDGGSITPEQISEVDKRKWDKFLVTLRLKDGEAVRLDLLRYVPLEEWVLQMERRTDGYEPPEDEASAGQSDSGEARDDTPEPPGGDESDQRPS